MVQFRKFSFRKMFGDNKNRQKKMAARYFTNYGVKFLRGKLEKHNILELNILKKS